MQGYVNIGSRFDISSAGLNAAFSRFDNATTGLSVKLSWNVDYVFGADFGVSVCCLCVCTGAFHMKCSGVASQRRRHQTC